MSLSAAFRRFGIGLLVSVVALLLSSASALAETKTFASTGKEQEFKVPAGVTSVHVVAIGSGGAHASGAGGQGAIVSGDLTVKPEQVLYVEVGGVPFNGGGSSSESGSGGGASDVRTVSIGAQPSPGDEASLNSRLLVAAGGGGGGNADTTENCAGGRGGNAEEKGANGENCGLPPGEGGGAGEAKKGGAGGTGYGGSLPFSPANGGAGKLGVGGGSGQRGGGGGGGLFGGGGGGTQDIEVLEPPTSAGDGGGGGGSDLVPEGGTFVGTAKAGEEGSVTITYTLPPQTCGKTTIGKVSDALVANVKRVNKCVVAVNAAVSELHAYLQPTKVKGQQLIEGVIYSDNKGKPGERLGTSTQLTFKSTEAAGWYSLPFSPPVKLTAGTYWIGIITGNSGKVAAERYDAVTNAEDYNTNTYTSGPSNPFGSFKTTSEEMSLYATYTPEQLPCASVGGSPAIC
jgi:hypothetical protein